MQAVAEKQPCDAEHDISQLRYYSPAQVAGIFGKNVATIYRAIKAGEIPTRRFGGSLLIPRSWVDGEALRQVNG